MRKIVSCRVLVLLGCLAAMPLRAEEDAARAASRTVAKPTFRVSYVSGERVYLDGGRARGLVEGARLELVREGVAIARLVVDFVAEHSASCRVVTSSASPATGDLAVLAGKPSGRTDAAAGADEPGRRAGAAVGTAKVPVRSAARPEAPAQEYRPSSAAATKPASWGRASGSFTLGWRDWADGGVFDRNWSESSARFSLRLLDIRESAWSLRTRVRRREIARSRDWSARNPRNESDDRLYELSLVYEKPEGRAIVHLGRLGASPFIGLGTFDGALGQYRVSRHAALGAFYGSAAEVESLGLQSLGEKYGAYGRFFSARPGERSSSRMVSDVVVGVLGEYEGGEVSREYLAVETRLRSGSRWHLFQRAELDLQRDWRRELTGRSSQLTNLSLSGSLRLSSGIRLLVAYDQFRPYRSADTRYTPEEVFSDVLRQGFRAGVSFGGARGLRGSTMVGMRRQDGGGASTTSLQTTLLYSTSSRVFYGADLSGWGGDASDGFLVTAHMGRAFKGGHDVRLTLGHSSTTAAVADGARTQDWVRVGGRYDLPLGLYVYGEAELVTGDDREGKRLLLDLGYRF